MTLRDKSLCLVVALAAAILLPLTISAVDAQDEEAAKQLVVMIKGKIGEAPVTGAGIIFGIESDRLYIATASHVTRAGRAVGQDFKIQLERLRGEWFEAVLTDSYDRDLDISVLAVVRGADTFSLPTMSWQVLASTQ